MKFRMACWSSVSPDAEMLRSVMLLTVTYSVMHVQARPLQFFEATVPDSPQETDGRANISRTLTEPYSLKLQCG
jgi:hypothetical protein